MISCKQIQSHEREQEWTHDCAKFAPLSCKHLFVLESVSIVTWQFMPPFFFSLGLLRTRKNCFYRKRSAALFWNARLLFKCNWIYGRFRRHQSLTVIKWQKINSLSNKNWSCGLYMPFNCFRVEFGLHKTIRMSICFKLVCA